MGAKGSGGKNRKSTARKKAEGNRGKRALNLAEPAALPGEPEIPKELSKAAREVWPQIVATLQANTVLFKTDSIAVAALCSSYVHFFLADAQVQEYGTVMVELHKDSKGSPTGLSSLKMNPAVRVRSDALKHLRACWQVFGLDPSSRSGIQLPDSPDAPSKLRDIMRAKGPGDDVVN